MIIFLNGGEDYWFIVRLNMAYCEYIDNDINFLWPIQPNEGISGLHIAPRDHSYDLPSDLQQVD